MTTFGVRLGASGLNNIAASKAENDFSFIVGDRTYSCPWFVADFISPRIAHLHEVDASVNEFLVTTEDCENEFSTFLGLGRGLVAEVSERNRLFLLSLAGELGNVEFYFAIVGHLSENISISTF
jgi:hypothetical protein